MAEAAVPVDLFNPGQVFACLGLMEAAEVLLGGAEGGFDWSNEADTRFILRAAGDRNPVEAVLEFLQSATTEWISPSQALLERDGGQTIVLEGLSFSKEVKPADLPGWLVGRFQGRKHRIPIGYWANETVRFPPFKKSTYANSAFVRFENALAAIRSFDLIQASRDPFNQSARTKSLFRLDPRGSTDPLNAGTSPDTLRKGGIDIRVATFPLCEALAVIGLENARPKIVRDSHSKEDAFIYHVWGCQSDDYDYFVPCLPVVLARAALGSGIPFLAGRKFRVVHDEAKEGGDRIMLSITEEVA